MNHTTLERIVAISLVAAMTTIGISVFGPAKVMAAADDNNGNGNGNGIGASLSLDNGAYSIKSDDGRVLIRGPLGDIGQERPNLPDLSSVIPDICPGNSGNPGQGCENGNAGGNGNGS